MALCSKCSTLVLVDLWNNDVVFHENLQALVQSAEQGCAFCRLCWTRIQQDCAPADVQLCLAALSLGSQISDVAIYITGELHPVGLVPNEPSQLYVSCGKMPGKVGDLTTNGLFTRLHIFAEPGSPATVLFGERYITVDRNPNLHVDHTRQWLEFCRKHHNVCNYASHPEARRMPTRVIDVGDPDSKTCSRLVLTKDLKNKAEKYISLSYCWGVGVQHAVELRDHNLADLLICLPEKNLTKTHQEAIQLTRELGIRYLWIDSLCIIQDNLGDWESESKRMASVYGGAELTIIAGRAADSREGFVANNYASRKDVPQPVPLMCGPNPLTGEGDLGHLYVCIPRSKAIGPVTSRGWCFQEAIFSTRAILFCEEQLSFRCRMLARWEDGRTAVDGNDASFHLGGPRPGSKPEVLRRWYAMLSDFTSRELTEPNDIFASITSIAQLVHSVVKCRYLAGLWEDDMPRGLMWKARIQLYAGRHPPLTKPKASGRRKGEPKGDEVKRAPSWSWASVQGPVAWIATARREPRYLDEHNICVRPRHEDCWAPLEDWGEPDRLYMPALELHLWGRPVEVRCAAMTVAEYVKSLPEVATTNWGPKHRVYGVLLETLVILPNDNVPNGNTAVAGVGYFDFPDDAKPTRLWCLQLVKAEGLLLTRDVDEKFRRVGWFLVESNGYPEGASEVAVDLV
ncbi:heterokaryon incompatibility protein-domain-containing protein [Lasiosphaeria miniovina]|uniref:Heterokaryon incompatibility protein-domain-containing protein n=1 Tax=Lasiosphaeria miniovina TaxID=1954250 RepID=A0AA40DZV5_9PEZI|nr:heterokaryon incompatibility protein-domain-containing protein [Lasiosphaeria miniovina]KAK0721850.1 heterokaryon incompatibility protein-domain-containing protein [Lasiosphaeria miniovina]